MKFTSIFFTASAKYLRVYLKDTNKQARNMKFTSIFFTASAKYLRVYLKESPPNIKKQVNFIWGYNIGVVHI